MIQIPGGHKFALNADGTAVVCGYETVKHVDLLTGVETPWPMNGSGAWYPGGWMERAVPVVFTPTQGAPPMTTAYFWGPGSGTMGLVGEPEHAVGHAGLAVIAGQQLSTTGAQVWHNGADITPEPFNGPVWDDPAAYGYKRGWDGGGPFVVRGLPGNLVAREIAGAGMWERVYTLAGEPWVTGQYGAEARVHAPTFLLTLPFLERSGPVVARDGVVYVVSLVMGAQQNPRGVMVRPLESLRPADPTAVPSLLGWWLPDVRHQGVQARVRPDSTIVVGGAEWPGSGVLTIAEIEPGRPMTVVPPEVIVPPVDPPVPPDPPPAPVRELTLLVSADIGQAPLVVEARVYDSDPTRPIAFFARPHGTLAWDLQALKSPGDAQHFYSFAEPGTYDTKARQEGAVDSNIRTVTVVAPPPPPEPEPTPPSGGWLARLLALLFRRRRA